MGAEALKEANEKDSFWQVHGLVDHVTRQAKFYWEMVRTISVDEAVIPFNVVINDFLCWPILDRFFPIESGFHGRS